MASTEAQLAALQAREADLRAHGAWTEALEILGEMLDVDPAFSPALNNKAAILLLLGDPEAALPYAERAVTADRGNAVALNNLGRCVENEGRAYEASGLYLASYDAGYSEPGVVFNLGCAYLGMGRLDSAVSAWRDAVTGAQDPASHQRLAALADAMGLPEHASLEALADAIAVNGRGVLLQPSGLLSALLAVDEQIIAVPLHQMWSAHASGGTSNVSA